MPFTAEDCKRLTGTDTPDYYTTPADWTKCKNFEPDSHFAIPCWHPHCDCQEASQEKKLGLTDLAKLAAWAIGILLIVLACGAVAHAQPYRHHAGGHHVSQSIRHQHEARRHHAGHHLASEGDRDLRPSGGFSLFTASGSLVAEARSQVGNGAVYGRSTLWCARFVNWVLAHTGHSGTGSDMAASFAHYGQRVSGPEVGAIAVMARRGGGHVGIVSGVDASGNPILISGNNLGRVREAPYPRNRIYAYVVPK